MVGSCFKTVCLCLQIIAFLLIAMWDNLTRIYLLESYIDFLKKCKFDNQCEQHTDINIVSNKTKIY